VSPFEEQPSGGALLRSVLSLAGRGWYVFPCVPGGKRPALRGNWQDFTTTDPDRLRAWWARTAYNIGVACGPSGLVVIDLDAPHTRQPGDSTGTESGADALTVLCSRHGRPYPLPTYAVDTPPGGCHLYYAAPHGRIRNSAGRLGPLIDVRATGGYVIGKDSRIGGRAYTERDARMPVALPAWIADLLQDGPPTAGGITLSAPRGAYGTAYAVAALRQEARLVAAGWPAGHTQRHPQPRRVQPRPTGSRRAVATARGRSRASQRRRTHRTASTRSPAHYSLGHGRRLTSSETRNVLTRS